MEHLVEDNKYNHSEINENNNKTNANINEDGDNEININNQQDERITGQTASGRIVRTPSRYMQNTVQIHRNTSQSMLK